MSTAFLSAVAAGRQLRDAAFDIGDGAAFGVDDRLAHGIFQRLSPGRPMRLDNGLADTEQRCAADLVIIKHFFELAKPGLDDGARQLGSGVFHKNLFDFSDKEQPHALDGLEHDIAGKAVADQDVGRPFRNITAFDIADKVNFPLCRSLFQNLIGFAQRVGAFGLFGAVLMSPTRGFFMPICFWV